MRLLSQMILLASITSVLNASETGIDEKSIEEGYREQLNISRNEPHNLTASNNDSNNLNVSTNDQRNLIASTNDSHNLNASTNEQQNLQSSKQANQESVKPNMLSESSPSKQSTAVVPSESWSRGLFGRLKSGLSKMDPETGVKVGLAAAGLVGGAALLHGLAEDRRSGRNYNDGMNYGGYSGGYGGGYGTPYGAIAHNQAPIIPHVQMPIVSPPPAPMVPQTYQPPQSYQVPKPYQAPKFYPAPQMQQVNQTPQGYGQQLPRMNCESVQLRPYVNANEVMQDIQAAVAAQMGPYETPAPPLNPLTPRPRHQGEKSTNQVIYEIANRKGAFSFPQIFLTNMDEDTLPPPRGMTPIAGK